MRMVYSLVEEGIVKWVWGSLGLCVCAVPVFGARLLGMGGGEGGAAGTIAGIDFGSRTEGFVTNRRLLLSASDAMGVRLHRCLRAGTRLTDRIPQRLMSTYRDLSELSGYTARVSELLDTMDDVKAGRYQKKLVGGGSTAGRSVGKGEEVAENAKSESLLSLFQPHSSRINRGAPHSRITRSAARARQDHSLGRRDHLRQRSHCNPERCVRFLSLCRACQPCGLNSDRAQVTS